jgi:hypothetical protein
LAKRNTPSYWWKINAVHMGVMRRPLEQPLQLSSRCTGGDTSPCRAASNVTAPLGNSAHGQKFPVPANRNSLFPDGTGNWLQAIEFALRSGPKNRAKRPESDEISKISLLFSLFSGNARLRPYQVSTRPPIPTID